MVAGVLHTLWLHGRFKKHKTCRQILNTPFAGKMTPLSALNEGQRDLHEEFLKTPEADETVGSVLEKHKVVI